MLNEAVNVMVSGGGHYRDNITLFDKKGLVE